MDEAAPVAAGAEKEGEGEAAMPTSAGIPAESTSASTPLTAPITPLDAESGMGGDTPGEGAQEGKASEDIEMTSPERPSASAVPPLIALHTSTPTQAPARAPPASALGEAAGAGAGAGAGSAATTLQPASPGGESALDATSPSKARRRSKSPVALVPPTPSRVTRSRSRSPTPGLSPAPEVEVDAGLGAIPPNAIEASIRPAPSREAAQVGAVTTEDTAGTMRFAVGEPASSGGEGPAPGDDVFAPGEGDGQGGERLREEPGNEAEAMDVDAIGHER